MEPAGVCNIYIHIFSCYLKLKLKLLLYDTQDDGEPPEKPETPRPHLLHP